MNLFLDVSPVLVDLCILYAVVMWWLQHRVGFMVPIREAAKIFASAFLVQFVFYLVFSIFPIAIEVRQYMVRMSIIVVALSQAIPLTVAFYASKHIQRGD